MAVFDATFGALYIGAAISLVLFGVTVLQTHFYYLYYDHDSVKLKFWVAFIFVMDAIHSAFICHANYYYLISSFAHPENLKNAIWSLFIGAGLTVLLSVAVKSFYITQIYRLCRPRWRWWICSALIISALAHLASGFETISNDFIEAKFSTVTRNQTSDVVLSITNIVSDTMISVVLCVLLWNRHLEVEKSGTKRVINNIIIFCVERFVLCMLISIILLIAEVALPLTFIDAAIDMVYGKVVANSFLATLNSRMSLKGSSVRGDLSSTGDSTSIPMSRRPKTTTITSMYTTGVTVESSIDDAEGYGLRTRDLEASIRSGKS